MSAAPNFRRIDGAISKLDSKRTENGVQLTRGADLTPTPIRWLWRHWLARGKLHILAGAPGVGKTTIAMAAIATVTSGGRWPDGEDCAAGNVLLWSSEDDAADTLLPRLLAMGADVKRVHFVTGTCVDGELLPFDPARDLVQLTTAAERIGDVRLVVVDPVVSVIAGDSHKNAEVRSGLQPLVNLGASLDAAVLGISHFSKNTAGRDPVERVCGSLAFGAVARVVMAAAEVKDEDSDTKRRIFVRAKCNIAPPGGGFEYSLDQCEAGPGIFASRLRWGAEIEGSARDLLRDAEADSEDAEPAHDVDAFLRGCLADGPVSAGTVKRDADGAGYPWRTVQRASHRLGVERRKLGLRDGWVWSLPASETPRRRHLGAQGAVDASEIGTASSASSGVSVAPSGDAEVL